MLYALCLELFIIIFKNKTQTIKRNNPLYQIYTKIIHVHQIARCICVSINTVYSKSFVNILHYNNKLYILRTLYIYSYMLHSYMYSKSDG